MFHIYFSNLMHKPKTVESCDKSDNKHNAA